MSVEDDCDPWAQISMEIAPAATVFEAETIEDVEPLGDQFGVAEPITVPEALQDALFGHPDSTGAEITAHGSGSAPLPALHTYAILDAAKVQGLPELLEASDLPHRCLFKGAAYDELKDAAPWVVQLKENNAFTRNLFRNSNAPWHLWDKQPGIYIRSRAKLDDIRTHFRKFTRVRDDQGQWYYFRFWEAVYAKPYFVSVLQTHERRQRWFHINAQHQVSILVPDPGNGTLTICKAAPGERFDGPNAPFELGPFEREIFAAEKRRQFLGRLSAYLDQHEPAFQMLPAAQKDDLLTRMVSTAHHFDLNIEKAVADFALAFVRLRRSPADDPVMLKILNTPQHPMDRARLVLEEAQARMRG